VVSKVLRRPSPQRHSDLRSSTEKASGFVANLYPSGVGLDRQLVGTLFASSRWFCQLFGTIIGIQAQIVEFKEGKRAETIFIICNPKLMHRFLCVNTWFSREDVRSLSGNLAAYGSVSQCPKTLIQSKE
jgi:hypothetical protein